MARTEKEKRKGKKRKHETGDSNVVSDDEVATKSVIVEPEEHELEKSPQTKAKANKRKSNEDSAKAVKEKRSKQKNGNPGNDDNNENADGDEVEMPTADQLLEAKKPENTNAIVTVRQKKKLKHQQRLESQKDQNADKESKRNEKYLRKWKDSRQEWKFEKLRQISIQQTAFDDQKLSTNLWPIALEYLAASNGAAKKTITELAEQAIQQLDKQCEELEDEQRQAIVDSVRYQRARNLLQSFD